jgi:hypothetical protein
MMLADEHQFGKTGDSSTRKRVAPVKRTRRDFDASEGGWGVTHPKMEASNP